MQKLRACRNRRSEIQRRRSTSSSCMIAICPAGPPKLMQPSFSQKRKASDSEGRGLAVIARDDRERRPGMAAQRICLRINRMEVGMDEIAPDAEAWAIAHDFTPTESEPNGATRLLREGVLGIAATSYAGYVLGRDATLYEFSVGSPTVSDAFGGGGVDGSWFTLFLVPIDDPGFRRLPDHPKKKSDRDWWNRLLGRDDVRETGDVDFDQHHQVIASSDLDNERFAELVGNDLISLMNANTDLLVEVERSELGDAALLVALPGIGIGDEGLDRLLAATEHVVGLFSRDAADRHPGGCGDAGPADRPGHERAGPSVPDLSAAGRAAASGGGDGQGDIALGTAAGLDHGRQQSANTGRPEPVDAVCGRAIRCQTPLRPPYALRHTAVTPVTVAVTTIRGEQRISLPGGVKHRLGGRGTPARNRCGP